MSLFPSHRGRRSQSHVQRALLNRLEEFPDLRYESIKQTALDVQEKLEHVAAPQLVELHANAVFQDTLGLYMQRRISTGYLRRGKKGEAQSKRLYEKPLWAEDK